MKRSWIFAVLLALFIVQPVSAHEVRPAYLQIDQTGPHAYTIVWKTPAMGEMALHLVPHISNGWLEKPPADQYATIGFLVKTWKAQSNDTDPLEGRAIAIEGLEQTITDVLVRVEISGGRETEAIVHPDHPRLELHFERHDGLPVPAYLELGVEHILTGIDHLMFVLGLLLLVGIRWELIKAITAFTAAHSITLAITAVGIIHVPSAVVESLVALSIVFVASELAHGDKTTLTHRYPWVIAFTFGLLHGMAFAGALAEVGLPAGAIPLSLFLFNVGVEIGQLLFVSAAIGAIFALRLLWPLIPAKVAIFMRALPPYIIGSFAAFWFIGRVVFVFA
jgi:hydrogenase/urease accessory protein HupE